MKVLVVGAGGREHALAWKIRQSPLVTALYIAPGNPGSGEVATRVDCKETDIEGLLSFVTREGIDLTVVGPEVPLSLGVVDKFMARGLKIFGPSIAAARLESSKEFSKGIMKSAGVPTPSYKVCVGGAEAEDYCRQQGAPLVLKADGLAAGKGVVVCHTDAEIQEGLRFLFEDLHAERLVIEEFVAGKEASFFVATDGRRIVPLPTAHDYKRIFDGNKGPNTGGMGAISPTPYLSMEQESFILERIVRPVLQEMERQGTPFVGFLYAGLMLPEGREPLVIEFNARFGDPECQPIMRRLTSDLLPLLEALAEPHGEKPLPEVSWSDNAAVCVNLASEGYPVTSSSGDEISGVDEANALPGVVVFHAGTSRGASQELMTAGGRVINVTAVGKNVQEALTSAYAAADRISFRGRQLRRDIGGPNG